jgi:hypothetical protein
MHWPMDQLEVTRETTLTSNAYFGRSDLVSSVKKYIDIHAGFQVNAVATAIPLPVRPEGIKAPEWVHLNRFIRATSPAVSVVRAVLPDQVRVRLVKLGLTNDGTHWLTSSIGRVEGEFSAGPLYRPRKTEIITVLVRRLDSRDWTVAGETVLGNNRGVFVLPSADLSGGGRLTDPMVAIAVVSYLPFDDTKPISGSEIVARQIAMSDEESYRIITPRGAQ